MEWEYLFRGKERCSVSRWYQKVLEIDLPNDKALHIIKSAGHTWENESESLVPRIISVIGIRKCMISFII